MPLRYKDFARRPRGGFIIQSEQEVDFSNAWILREAQFSSRNARVGRASSTQ
jgi:hypothetical protein